MIRYTIRRLLWGIIVLLVITMITFLLFGPVLNWRTQTDAARLVAGPRAGAPQLEQVRRFLGLKKPFYEQYYIYVKRIALGPSAQDKRDFCPVIAKTGANGAPIKDANGKVETTRPCGPYIGHLGRSFLTSQSVDRRVAQAAPLTFSLAIVTAIIWLSLSIPIGILSAIRSRTFFDRASVIFVLGGQALPVYYFGLLALYILAYLPTTGTFGFHATLFPIGGYHSFHASNPWPWLHALILPGATLALQFAAQYVRITRSSMISTMNEDYIRTARAKGAPERRVIVRHGLRNSLLPLVTMFGLDFATLLGGAVLTETTFGIQGLGLMAVQSVEGLDVPSAAGVIVLVAFLIVFANIVVDLLYAVIDPRIRLA